MLREFLRHQLQNKRGQLVYLATALVFIFGSFQTSKADVKRLRALDIEVNYAIEESDWTGCQKGGYFPVRIEATNKSGKTKRLNFVVFGYSGGNSPRTTKQIELDPNVTAKFTLPIPVVTQDNTYMRFRVLVDGRAVNELTDSFSLPDIDYTSARRPSMLILSSDFLLADFFEQGVSSIEFSKSPGHGGHSYTPGTNHAIIDPDKFLPESWISYSGLDLLAIATNSFESLTNDQKQAIMKWVRTGGNLVLFNTKNTSATTKDVEDFFGLSGDSKAWIQPESADFRKLVVALFDDSGNIIGKGTTSTKKGSKKAKKGEAWSNDQDVFQFREVMLGTVTLFKENPFPGTTKHWQWYLETLGPSRTSWQKRNGINARSANSGFLKFLIPSVSTVPIIAFLILITVFTVLIGPANYFYFKRRKELVKLLISVPLIAITTSLLLVGYSTIAHGIGIRTRIRSVTLLDQRNNNAVTVSRVALYAGLAPSSGLQFSPDTAVYPIWHESGNVLTGDVDWTNSQHFQSGWLRSRTRTQFATINHRTERGRINFASKEGTLTAENGLEWDLKAILVADENGQLYFGNRIDAGASAKLAKATKEDCQQFKEMLNSYPMELPAGRKNASDFISSSRSFSTYGYPMDYMDSPAKYSDAKTEQIMLTWKASLGKQPNENGNPNPNVFRPKTYIAIFDERPEIDLGKLNPSEEASLHVIKGYF